MLLYESPKGESFAFRRWEYFYTILSALTCCCMLYASLKSEIFTFGKFKQNKVHFLKTRFAKWNFQILKILSKIKLPFASPACSGGGVSLENTYLAQVQHAQGYITDLKLSQRATSLCAVATSDLCSTEDQAQSRSSAPPAQAALESPHRVTMYETQPTISPFLQLSVSCKVGLKFEVIFSISFSKLLTCYLAQLSWCWSFWLYEIIAFGTESVECRSTKNFGWCDGPRFQFQSLRN